MPTERPTTFPEYGRGAVDRFDVAAELEASGYSERLSRIHLDGRTLFEVADVLLARRPMAERVARPRAVVSRDDLYDAALRAVLLIAGIVLVGAVLRSPAVSTTAVTVASLCGWVGGQASMAILWARRGAGDLPGGIRAAGQCAAFLVVLVTVGAVSWPSGSGRNWVDVLVVGGVQTYIQCVGLLTASPRFRVWGVCVVAAAGAVAAAVLLDAAPVLVGVFEGLVLVGVVVVTVRAWWKSEGSGFRMRDLRVVPPATLQATMLAVTVLGVMAVLVGAQSMRFVVVSVVTIALTDPFLTAVRRRLQLLASRTRSWTVVGVCAGATMVGVGILLPLGAVASMLGAGERDPWTLTVLGLYLAVSIVSAILRGMGAPWASLAVAVPFALVIGSWQQWSTGWELVVLVVTVVGGMALVALWSHDPRRFL